MKKHIVSLVIELFIAVCCAALIMLATTLNLGFFYGYIIGIVITADSMFIIYSDAKIKEAKHDTR